MATNSAVTTNVSMAAPEKRSRSGRRTVVATHTTIILHTAEWGKTGRTIALGCPLRNNTFAHKTLINTKYFNRQLKRLNNKIKNNNKKNVDVEGDYLINGMYL